MEEELVQSHQTEEENQTEAYTPRPRWQIWAARIGLVLFVITLIFYYINMLRGGI